MTIGKLGSADLTAATDTMIFQASVDQVFNLRIANRNTSAITVRTAVGPGAGTAPANEDYISYDIYVGPGCVLEETGVVASAGEKIWVYSDTANVSVRAYGM